MNLRLRSVVETSFYSDLFISLLGSVNITLDTQFTWSCGLCCHYFFNVLEVTCVCERGCVSMFVYVR